MFNPVRIGWVVPACFAARRFNFLKPSLRTLESFSRMRTGNIADHINLHNRLFRNELYESGKEYQVVIFQKMMDARSREEALKIRQRGGRIIFDANVNYYQVWGEYDILNTMPTLQQQEDALWMTKHADHVVADSSYLLSLIRDINPRSSWIPDNVNLDLYRYSRVRRNTGPVVTLVWSGIAKKARPLLFLKDVFSRMRGRLKLVIVSDEKPDVMTELEKFIPCKLVRFSDRGYAATLRCADIIISPKRLCNGYEMAHTEYKITLGMAMGLPAVASPQQSYVEAISYGNGGIIADTESDWYEGLNRLVADRQLRLSMGEAARKTVIEKYSTPVIAGQYLNVIKGLF